MHSVECAKPALTRLMWLHKSGEPPDHADHQITYDHDIVEICPSCNGATIEHLRHDCFDYEAVYDQYEWYELGPEDGARLRTLAARCDRPLEPFCNCATHKALRTSALALPSGSWDAIFEGSAHRHIITVSDGKKPAFTLVRTGVELPKPLEKPKEPDTEAVGFIFLAWPALLAITLFGWFRLVHLPWFLDAIVVLVAIPATFVGAGVILAAGKVILNRKRRSSDKQTARD